VKISTSSIHGEEKDILNEIINILGGTLISGLDKTTNYLIVRNNDNKKFTYAKENNIPIVIPQWIFESAKKGFFVNEYPYLYENTYDITESQPEELIPKIEQNDSPKLKQNSPKIILETKKESPPKLFVEKKQDSPKMKDSPKIPLNHSLNKKIEDSPLLQSITESDSWKNAPPPDALLSTDINSFQNNIKQLIESSGKEESQNSPLPQASVIYFISRSDSNSS
jgi:hypothetical protein